MMKTMKSGFMLIEMLIILVIVGILSTFVFNSFSGTVSKGKNAAIVQTLSNVPASIDASKYPESLSNLCNDFEPGNELGDIRTSIEKKGGIWNCDSTDDSYRIFVKLNPVKKPGTLSDNINDFVGKTVFAQNQNSFEHSFGNYYCLNSKFEKKFTHWPGDHLTFPSCDDSDYIPTPVDPEPTPEPTIDPNPTTDPEPPLENGAYCDNEKKQAVCHFGKTICISKKAVKAHQRHGDPVGQC